MIRSVVKSTHDEASAIKSWTDTSRVRSIVVVTSAYAEGGQFGRFNVISAHPGDSMGVCSARKASTEGISLVVLSKGLANCCDGVCQARLLSAALLT